MLHFQNATYYAQIIHKSALFPMNYNINEYH